MAGSLLPSNRRTKSFHRPPMSEINVVPFIDIMLVLLVVFMVTAPMMTQGVPVNLPDVETTPITEENEPLQVSIKQDGRIFIQEHEVQLIELAAKLKAIKEQRPKTNILLRADKNVNYGRVMEVMASLQQAGLVDVGLVTEPTHKG